MARSSRTDAEAKYAKAQQRQRDAQVALTEVAAEAKRITDNTARLKALRLAKQAKDATDAAAEAAANPPKAAKPKKKKAAPKSIPVEKLTAANDK